MKQTSPLDGYRKQIEDWVAEGHSYREIAAHLHTTVPTSEASVRRALRRWQGKNTRPDFEKPGVKVDGDDAEVTSDPRKWKPYLNDTDSLLYERGLDPEDWEIHSLTVNEWDSPTGEILKQLKLHLKRKVTLKMIVPARVALGRTWPMSKSGLPEFEPELVVFVGDQHAPFQQPELHRAFCEFLNDQRPERGVLMGDTVDYPNISRHPPEPDWQSRTQECLDAGGQLLVDYREAAEDTSWVLLDGNHEDRLRRAIVNYIGDLHGLRPAQVESLPDLAPIHDTGHLLRLDELGIRHLTPLRGSYKYGKYIVSPNLIAKHGDNVSKGSGVSALKALDGLDHSIVFGHTHRQSLVQKTVGQVAGGGRLLQAGETGCMCRIEEGLGYAVGADWSNGFITAAVYPDGTFKLDLATYVDRHLYWRSERY